MTIIAFLIFPRSKNIFVFASINWHNFAIKYCMSECSIWPFSQTFHWRPCHHMYPPSNRRGDTPAGPPIPIILPPQSYTHNPTPTILHPQSSLLCDLASSLWFPENWFTDRARRNSQSLPVDYYALKVNVNLWHLYKKKF